MSQFFQSRFNRYLIPFMVLLVGGSIGLREFTQLRYKYRRVKEYSFREQAKKEGIELKDPKEVTLEKQYEEMQKELDLDNWENVRIPRPWDETIDGK